MKKLKQLKTLLLSTLTAIVIIIGCQAAVEDLTGPSALGNILGIQGLFGGAGIPNDGASQATIRVEVYTTQNIPTEGATVFLTTTLGTLTASSLTTDASGTATTTLTSGTTRGTAYVTATVDNVSATTAVPII
ncbi:MAG: hypothetical protein F3742_08915 [Nitrospinae bacterium]|nr:hypothetical protein [Nitrospinota bacterium]MZH14875.1 hypothetical protein [Nitrospinota bacterium]